MTRINYDHLIERYAEGVKLAWRNGSYKRFKVDHQLNVDLPWGWMDPALMEVDHLTDKRWEHWCKTWMAGHILDEPIPHISFGSDASTSFGMKHLGDCLSVISKTDDDWMGWSGPERLDYFLDWLLYGMGYEKTRPKEPLGCEGASCRLFQVFNLGFVMARPYDYWGDLIAEARWGREQGFFPAPHSVAELMARLTIQPEMQTEQIAEGEDPRSRSVFDCAVGTGRLLLSASNYSYVLFGQDINATVIKATLVNGCWYAPWLVRPAPFIDRRAASLNKPEAAERFSIAGTLAGLEQNPALASYLRGAVFDPIDGTRYAPIIKLQLPQKV